MTRIRRFLSVALLAGALSVASTTANADDFSDTLHDIQHRWAEANYRQTGGAQKDAFEALLEDARDFAEANPGRAEALVWQGIVASTYAGVKGPFGAMSLAKEARDVLMQAEALDPTVLEGSVYTSLGTLYFKVPGGLIGFGDKDLARDYLEKALQENPDGIDPNYFYGEFLLEQKDYEAARSALLKAKNAPQRPDRPLADEGRQREIDTLLDEVNRKLGKHS
ncbi:MAG TPA: tetratricopeptide repeat protein [Woeseiaceae bacterium]|nr:tetratricopeptide repeat protein [Woeseiaceae bacterium]